MKKNGIKNIRCLISSYKFVFLKINIIGIEIVVIKIVPKTIFFFLSIKIFFSTNGIKKIPIIINKGNFTENQIGIYVAGKFFAAIHSPRVSVQISW